MPRAILNNRTILITRPKAQADRLIHLIESSGGRTLLLPVIEIEAFADPATEQQARALVLKAEILIFISVNAVRCLLGLITDAAKLFSDRSIYAVGGATSSCLQEKGFQHIQSFGIGSEALLDLPELQTDKVSGRVIVIVRGEGGREHLREQLGSRGARVHYLEVYRRRKPAIADELLKNIWCRNSPDAIVISSAEGVQNLIDMTPLADRAALFNTPLVVISERVSAYARSRGFKHESRVAVETSDEGLFAAVKQLFEVRQ